MPMLGKYEIIEQLGIGSMGTVYRARDTVLDREVALKTIRKSEFVDPELRERFYREARACARLQHPGIVTVFDLGESDGAPHIAMELLVGEDIRKSIDSQRFLPLALKLELMAQACEALAHAHRNGIVHRDIKPGNIFIQSEGGAKILDFGIARLPASNLTRMGKVLGTPNYMAPEQIQGRPCDGRSDLFAAAIVLFEFLTNVHPFQGDMIPKRIADLPPEKLRSIDPRMPVSLELVILKALDKDSSRRYQTGDELAAALRAVIGECNGAVPPEVTTAGLPAGEDSSERRISAFLRLLRQFDEALEKGAVPEARRILGEMKELAAVEQRFTTAVREYEGRLRSYETPVPAPKIDQTVALRPPPQQRSRGIVAGAVLLLALVSLLWVVSVRMTRKSYVLPALATATVIADRAYLFEGPRANETPLLSLRRGDRVNLLQLPRSSKPEWMQVQFVSNGNISPPGYAKSHDLGNWSEFEFVKAIGPGAAAADSERRAYIETLRTFVTHFPNSPDAGKAWTEIARQDGALARAARDQQNFDTEYRLAKSDYVLGNFQSARQRLDRALTARPDSSDAKALLEKIRIAEAAAAPAQH